MPSPLRHFKYKPATGGHANDGDQILAEFPYDHRDDLIHRLGQLGVKLATIPDDYPRPVKGVQYTYAEFSKFKSEIRRFPDLEQPGYVSIIGFKVFVWVYDNTFILSVAGTEHGNNYEVTQVDYQVCEQLEAFIATLGW